ncbi:MAG: fibro-slime domain-containing protein, partial [Proteobacteria bacterium]|nr:fibro-slime domain-containing protein [Pseudomonadota bacterium]
MVRDTLSSIGQPIKSDKVDPGSSNLNEWFDSKDGNDTCIDMVWKKTADGDWEFDSGKKGFFPIDGFDHPNNSKPGGTYKDDSGNPHNFHFSMEIHLQFQYEKGTAQLFEFRGDDDVWIYVNGILAIDIGGIHGAQDGSVNLDTDQNKLGLVDGETYALDIFFSERQTKGSNFRAKTSIDIKNDITLFYKSTALSSAITQYDILKYDLVASDECGFNVNYPSTDSVAAKVLFYLEGPQFTSKKDLFPGLYYDGIEIKGDSAVIVDTSSITGLEAGTYTISFVSIEAPSLSGSVDFILLEPVKEIA